MNEVNNSAYQLYSTEYVGDKSPYMVMQSPAGYYIGKTCWDTDIECYLPWNRYSTYFSKEGIAQDYLELCTEDEWYIDRYYDTKYDDIIDRLAHRKEPEYCNCYGS